MNGPEAIHRDVASYALGVLDDADAARFEEHLAGCATCAMELESMLPVAALLSQVDGDSLVGAEERLREGRMLDEMMNAVSYDRSRHRVRRTLALAAGVVALMLVAGLALFTGTLVGDDQGTVAQRPNTAATTSDPFGIGIGGPEDDPNAKPGEKFSGTDPTTKVTASVLLDTKDWGTQVSLLVGSLTGPRTCQLVAVGADGLGEVVYTWAVPAKGYGTKANPQPLFLQGATAVARPDIDRMEIQSVDEAGRAALLVAVEV